MMTQCWSESPDKRPSFKELAHEVNSLLVEMTDYLELMVHPSTS